MQSLPLTARLALALLAGTLCPACDKEAPPESAKPAAAVQAPTAPKHEPTEARLLERVRERWARAEAGDWVAAFEYQGAEVRKELGLAQYLAKAQHHTYNNVRVLEVLALQGDVGYVRVGGLWTPTHPQLKRVKLEPGQTLTQDIEIIETWRFADGDWFLMRPDRPEEFFEEHPELLRKGAGAAGGDGAVPPAPADPAGTPPK